MKKIRFTKTVLKQKSKVLQPKFVAVLVALAIVGGYLVIRSFAASASMSLVPSATTVNIGSTFAVAIKVNTGGDTVNFVQANLTYDATKLDYVSVDDTGTAFPSVASNQTGSGTLEIARFVPGGTAPVSTSTTDALVTTVTFRAKAGGSAVPISLGAGSVMINSGSNTDILAVKNNASLTLSDTQAPSVPTSLSAPTVTMTSIGLTWAASTDNVGVTSYRVYRGGTLLGTTTTTGYTDSGLAPGTGYSYTVSALDTVGNASAQTSALSVSTLADTQAPTVPGKPTSSAQTVTSITLSWTASTDNVGVTGYRVYRNGSQVATPTTTTYTDSGLTPSTSYSYTVSAYDAKSNTSAQSSATAVSTLADTTAPTVPTNLSSAVSGQNINLSWTASTDNVAVTGYVINRDGAQIGTATTNSFTVTNAPTGSHTYSVAAKDAANNTSAVSTAVTVNIFVAADINKDNKVNGFDISTVLSNWKTNNATADINKDGTVNGFDLSIVLSNWTG